MTAVFRLIQALESWTQGGNKEPIEKVPRKMSQVENAALAKEHRKHFTAAAFVLLILCLLAFLTYVNIPSTNKDLIVSIVSMIVGGLGMALSTLFGKDDEQLKALQEKLVAIQQENTAKVAALEQENSRLKGQLQAISAQYETVTRMLIERHVVRGEGLAPGEAPTG